MQLNACTEAVTWLRWGWKQIEIIPSRISISPLLWRIR
jgi:hypothetical protein